MKLNLISVDILFEELYAEMGIGASDISTWSGNGNWSKLNPEELEALSNRGVDITPGDINLEEGEPLTYRGEKVVLYIRDVKHYSHTPITLPKFHITFCRTLQKQQSNNRYNSRYVVTTRIEGDFFLNISGSEKWAKLDVCKNCLQATDYDNYSLINREKQDSAVKKFNLKDYFEKGYLNNSPRTTHSPENAPKNSYSEDWSSISIRLKDMMRWTCQECGIDLSKDRKFLETHHMDGNQSNNDPANLKVLCVGCHAFQPNHDHIRRGKKFIEYAGKYNTNK